MRRELVTGYTVRRYEQLETFPEMIEQESSTVKRELVKHSFDSAAEIAEEVRINVSQLYSCLRCS